jgi:energy-coupling factor transport system ATP-binding protein
MLIEIRDLTYTYPEETTPALAQLNLEIDAGQLVLLQGNSGSGKSTLIGSINGLVPHFYGGRFAGHVIVDGMDTRHAHPGELASRVGTVFQEPESRFVTSSVLEEIVFGLEATGLGAAEMRRRVDDITQRLNLGALLNRPLDKLSGGEQQRVALAVAMGRQPKVLLLDEPTSQLDRPTAAAVLAWLAELHESLGLTTLVAEHRLEGLIGMASRRLTLSKGRLAEPRADSLSLDGEILVDRPAPRTGGQLAGDDGKGSMPSPAPNRSSRLSDQGLPSRLSVKGLEAGYEHHSVLTDVCLDVYPGEIVALVGRNGSGKTTLLRSLMGLLPLRAGEVWLDGARVDGHRVAEVARRVAYVPQWPGTLLFADSVRDELTLTLRHHGLAKNPPLLPEDLLSELNLDRVAAHYPRDLSAGERQRAAIAAVIVTKPALLLLDEPTLGMDATVQESLGGLLHRLRKDGMSVLIATHDQSFACRFSDRVVALEAGRITHEDSLAENPAPSLREQPAKWPLQAQQGAQPRPARRPHA